MQSEKPDVQGLPGEGAGVPVLYMGMDTWCLADRSVPCEGVCNAVIAFSILPSVPGDLLIHPIDTHLYS